jgi:hypothetical protein
MCMSAPASAAEDACMSMWRECVGLAGGETLRYGRIEEWEQRRMEGERSVMCSPSACGKTRLKVEARARSRRNLGICTSCTFLAQSPASPKRQTGWSNNAASPMPKRKRGAGQEATGGIGRKSAAVERQIVLGKRELTKSLKLAKGFERQKLGRREKDARAKQDAADVERVELDIAALKVRSCAVL